MFSNSREKTVRTGRTLSQNRLILLRFKKNKVAVVSLIVLMLIYGISLFAEFFAPYDLSYSNNDFLYMPPMKVHFKDENGAWTRPFVYPHKSVLNQTTYVREFAEDRASGEKFPIGFFIRSSEYKYLGFRMLKNDLHFIGVEKGYLFLLGTDQFGHDLLSHIMYGTRISIFAGLLGVLLSVVLGTVIGTFCGYLSGTFDMVMQRIIEFLRSFPRFPLWMTLSVALPPTWSSVKIYFGIVTILALIGWTGLAREIRGKVLSMRNLDYVMAARAANASHWYIVVKQLIPNVMSHVIVIATISLPGMILGEASLSFLGLGIQPPMTSLGVLLQAAQNMRSIINYPWLFTPAIIIIFFILSFNFLGDGVRDAVDPYSN